MRQLRLTQHKRFVPDGTHPNPSLMLGTSFMLKTLDEMLKTKSLLGGKENAQY